MRDLVLAPGERLVHIGPHKTGTTTLQGAFHQSREQLLAHGVVYAGESRQAMRPALAVSGRKGLTLRQPELSEWTEFAADIAAAGDKRVAVSSEFFADADDDAIRRVVEDLGGSRVQIVVTLRPLTKIVASQWQQYVQSGLRMRYDQWLNRMFKKPPYRSPTPSFWRRHRHDRLVERWAAAAGIDNVTVVVPDESDLMMLTRTFESMLALPAGVLAPESERTNRSLTAGEIELVRQLNQEFRLREWPEGIYTRFLRMGVVQEMKAAHQPSPKEPRIVTPGWAIEQAAGIGAEMAEKIKAFGVQIVGDIDTLGVRPAGLEDLPAKSGRVNSVSVASAVQAALGAIVASGATDPAEPENVEHREIREADAKTLAQVLVRRARRRARRTIRRRIAR